MSIQRSRGQISENREALTSSYSYGEEAEAAVFSKPQGGGEDRLSYQECFEETRPSRENGCMVCRIIRV
ncbi:hypothetical protein P8452_17328 [Trifolium repens]|nr:hypothetical protein P8452_17328 [Trifolium repens]